MKQARRLGQKVRLVNPSCELLKIRASASSSRYTLHIGLQPTVNNCLLCSYNDIDQISGKFDKGYDEGGFIQWELCP